MLTTSHLSPTSFAVSLFPLCFLSSSFLTIDPQQIQQVIELARGRGIDTIYSEDLIDPRLTNVIAQEIPNSKVLVLSPIEGINKEEQNAGEGYLIG